MSKTITAKLPFFQGFYGTAFEMDWDEYERIVEDTIEKAEYINETTLSYGDFEFDLQSYERDIACMYIEAFKKFKPFFVEDIEFVRLIHPKDYNEYVNDEIEVKFKLSDDFRKELISFMLESEKWLIDKIQKDWSDKPNFWSFLSNRYDKWVQYIHQSEITQTNSAYYAALIGYYMLEGNFDIPNIIDKQVIDKIDLLPYIKCIAYGK